MLREHTFAEEFVEKYPFSLFPAFNFSFIAVCIHSIGRLVLLRVGLVLFVALLDVSHQFVHSLKG
jgi:uncharacterized membrane protein